MKTKFWNLLFLLTAILPNNFKRFIYNHVCGHDIHPTAIIGLSFIKVKKMRMGPYSRIGNFNVIRNLEFIELGDHATIGNHNRADALPLSSEVNFSKEVARRPGLTLGNHSAITSRHYFDCNNTVCIGNFSTIAGEGTMFFTHGINIEDNRQQSEVVTVGDFCIIGARCVLVKGASLPDYSVLGANSTLHKKHTSSYTLYSGVPAIEIGKLSASGEYFKRQIGFVN